MDFCEHTIPDILVVDLVWIVFNWVNVNILRFIVVSYYYLYVFLFIYVVYIFLSFVYCCNDDGGGTIFCIYTFTQLAAT